MFVFLTQFSQILQLILSMEVMNPLNHEKEINSKRMTQNGDESWKFYDFVVDEEKKTTSCSDVLG